MREEATVSSISAKLAALKSALDAP